MKFLVSVFLCLLLWNANAQSVKAVYSVKRIVSQGRIDAMSETARKNFEEENARIKLYSLDFCDGISLYQNCAETKNTMYQQELPAEYALKENEKITTVNRSFEKLFFKDFRQDLMIFKLNNSGIDFQGKDNLLKWNWQITEESKEIKGFKCKKAVSDAYGGKFIAWFATEIPVKAGPEKFDGLPGLILSVQTSGEEFTIEDVITSEKSINIEKPTLRDKTVTWVEMLMIARNKFEGEKSFNGFGSKFSSY